MNQRQQELRARGLCICCGSKSRGVNRNTGLPYSLCEVCNDRNLRYTKDRQARFQKQGRCHKCGVPVEKINPDTDEPYRLCTRCNTKSRSGMYDRRKRYKIQGRCRTCGNPVEDGSPISCRKCMDKRNKTRRKKNQERKLQ